MNYDEANVVEITTEKVKKAPKKVLKKRKKTEAENSAMLKIAHTKVDPSVNAAKERRHVQEATRGVVQLFNMVRDRQKLLEEKVKLLEKGTRAQRRQALEQIRSEARDLQTKRPKIKVEVKEDEEEYNTSGGESFVEVKKEGDDESSDENTSSSSCEESDDD